VKEVSSKALIGYTR